MSSKRYNEEFRIEAVKQVTERGYSASEVAKRLGVNSNSIYNWLKKYGQVPQHAAKHLGHTILSVPDARTMTISDTYLFCH